MAGTDINLVSWAMRENSLKHHAEGVYSQVSIASPDMTMTITLVNEVSCGQ